MLNLFWFTKLFYVFHNKPIISLFQSCGSSAFTKSFSHCRFLFSALFLLDAGGECLWLWQGWWPDAGHETGDTNLSTGSGLIRWHAERRVAMETVLEFRDLKYRDASPKPDTRLVWAGHEPMEFTNLFPSWKERKDVQLLNLKVRSTIFFPRYAAILFWCGCAFIIYIFLPLKC